MSSSIRESLIASDLFGSMSIPKDLASNKLAWW